METFFLIFILIIAVIVTNALYTKFKLFPVAFLQIAAGLILSILPVFRHFELEPEIFMLVIISMLMFNDGQNTNLSRLTRHMGTTFSLAVELVIITILIVGFLTHWLIPSISLALAFALGAIIVPTDAVAVSSITTKVLVPKDVMNTLENESLFNDASGIVALNLAIAAVVTGQFSLWHGIGNFLYVFFGGIIVGLVLGIIIINIRIRFIKAHVDTPSVMVPYTLMTPFVVYLAAEAVGVSGILAVVVTGLLHGVQQNRLRLTSSRLQIAMTTTWSVVASALNGIVFVLLGLSLPIVIKDLSHNDTGSVITLVGVGILLYLVMTLLRFLWVQFDFARIRSWNKHDKLMNSIVMALSGVHGTITLSLAFSLPLTLHGHAFTFRNDLIFISAVVILTSLLIPTIILPLMLPNKVSKYSEDELVSVKSKMVDDAINTLLAKNSKSPAVSQVISVLDGQRIVERRADRNKLAEIFNHCFEIEETTVEKMYDEQGITQSLFEAYMRVAQTTVQQYQKQGWEKFHWFWRFQIVSRLFFTKEGRASRKMRKQMRPASIDPDKAMEINRQFWQKIAKIETEPYNKVVTYLSEIYNDDNSREIGIARRAYDERHRRLNSNEQFVAEQNELLIQAFQQEYNFVYAQSTAKKINAALSNALYEQISTDQLVYTQSVGPSD
ncbi:cation:proton antiporter [Companilactobacillus sp.]|jgi:CPA1 family monovalent cation:H+ antiporter|uniref:cation:proton antiporter n=1 Tax=Companilactobacillus sp. TaxID=2767905 RepID=UPI0025BE00E9|nr:sodium:proton antiporter [Companilactobacillus sp.]MCH4008782.1 sodium:proton antiporter [Companilactobacillus sp.]MCH4051039.1 sodium:proton antiporter [Companilactobacillus sp.]MCH4076725.1 sodium:proton antiporter [Companilactobacillus sp.]MCH4125300.1 sodium:proton antiporter [Companilactobacillus sp.]MCH4131840.1 sodium:proton antiporter [Companilactobacillus sp.]